MTPLRTPEARWTPREASDQSLPALLDRADEAVVVESYFAGWATPWRALTSEAWHELIRALGERALGAVVETGANRALAVRYGLEVIPTVLVFLRGEIVARLTGRVTPEAVAAAVRSALERDREREAVALELEAALAARERASPVRSILRRRSGAAAIAHAG